MMGNAASIKGAISVEVDALLQTSIQKHLNVEIPLNQQPGGDTSAPSSDLLQECLSPQQFGLPSPPHVAPVRRYKKEIRQGLRKKVNQRLAGNGYKPAITEDHGSFTVEIYAPTRRNAPTTRKSTRSLPVHYKSNQGGHHTTTEGPIDPRNPVSHHRENEGTDAACSQPVKAKTPAGMIKHGLTSFSTLAFLKAQEIARLSELSSFYKDWVTAHEGAWQAMCISLWQSDGVHLPDSAPPGGWKEYFWDHAYPARQKWTAAVPSGGGGGRDFKIQVAVRFKPGPKAAGRGFLLPLHQRLQLLDRPSGERLRDVHAEKLGLPAAALEKLVAAGAGLSPEVLRAVADAEAAELIAREARAEGRRGRAEAGAGWEEGEEGEGRALERLEARRAEMAEERDFDPEALPPRAPGTEGVDGGGDGRGGGAGQEDGEGGGGGDEAAAARRRREGARVLAVQPAQVVLYLPGQGVKGFAFARVFDGRAEQGEVYAGCARGPVLAALNGQNACLLCYGQTGSGKTHTVFGPPGVLDQAALAAGGGGLPPGAGVALRACREVLEAVRRGEEPGAAVRVEASAQYVELYQGRLTCLATGREAQLRDAGGGRFVCRGAAETPLASLGGTVALLQRGETWKHYAATAMNHRSSRAHTVFLVTITQTHRRLGAMLRSELHIVDLAGCEQIKKSKVAGQARREAVGINSSLMVLGRVVRALLADRPHVPYYESKLTLLLKGAFGGSSRTAVVVTGSLADEHGDETGHAVRFGARCARVTNRAGAAEVTSVAAAAAAVDQALRRTAAALRGLEARGKGHLPACRKLRERRRLLLERRKALPAAAALSTVDDR